VLPSEPPDTTERLNLPNMKYSPAQRVEVYAQAVRGLIWLEPDPEKQLKYLDFIDIYTGLDDNEWERYQQEYTALCSSCTFQKISRLARTGLTV
jgi:hypothetical protein